MVAGYPIYIYTYNAYSPVTKWDDPLSSGLEWKIAASKAPRAFFPAQCQASFSTCVACVSLDILDQHIWDKGPKLDLVRPYYDYNRCSPH